MGDFAAEAELGLKEGEAGELDGAELCRLGIELIIVEDRESDEEDTLELRADEIWLGVGEAIDEDVGLQRSLQATAVKKLEVFYVDTKGGLTRCLGCCWIYILCEDDCESSVQVEVDVAM